MTDHAGLIARLEKATGPDREIDWDIDQLFTGEVPDFHGCPRYTASIDDALALVEKALPGWWGSVDFGDWQDNPYGARLNYRENTAKSHGQGPTPALAILIALLRALEKDKPHD